MNGYPRFGWVDIDRFLHEEKILRLHQTKRNLADAMLEGTNESHKLTSKDLLAMIDKDS